MKFWLMKNEPDDYSIDDLERTGVDHWDGIRNYQVRNFMRDEMSIGDLAFFYHSSCKEPGIFGMMEIVSDAYPDHTAWDPQAHYFDPRSKPDSPVWLMVDVRFMRKFANPVTLKTLRVCPELSGMRILQRGNRLSVTPLSSEHWNFILALAGETA